MSNPRHQSPNHAQDSWDSKSGYSDHLVPKPSSPQPWEHNLWNPFSDCSICCTSYWCPCVLHGKTKHRLRNPDMATYSCCNTSCVGYAALAFCFSPLYVILGMRQRAEIRRTYNLAGGGCSDYWLSLCCQCCSMAQEELEVMKRADSLNAVGYQSPDGMVYNKSSMVDA